MGNKEEGPFYEDFNIGDKIKHSQGRTITDTENTWFSLLTCNSNQIHYDQDYVQKNFSAPPFNGRIVVNSFFTLAIIIGISSGDTSRNGIMLGISSLKMLNPVFAGDTIHAESEVVSRRESASHPSMGVVQIRTSGVNQDGTKVLELERTFMTRKRGKSWG